MVEENAGSCTQLSLFRRGGARPGAGRKPEGPRARVGHDERPQITKHDPVLVTTRVLPNVPDLRCFELLPTMHRALCAGGDRFGFRLVEFSIQTNHLHLMVEADDAEALARGMQGLQVRLARKLNREWDRKGSMFEDRYHERVLRSPLEVRNGLVYTLQNAHKHGACVSGIDPFSSGRWFDGWKNRTGRPLTPEEDRKVPTVRPQAWLLREGWRMHGLISVMESPASDAKPRKTR